MPVMGFRLSTNWVSGERPEQWRGGILDQYPDDYPLTQIMDRTKSSKATDYRVHWFQRRYATKELTISAGDTPGASTAGTADTLRVGASEAYNCKVGSIIWYPTTNERVLVTGVTDDDDLAIIRGIGLTAGTVVGTWTATYKCQVTSSAYSELADTPEAISFDPTEFWNYSQIVRTSTKMSWRSQRVQLRTGDQKKRTKKDALRDHMGELEWMYLTGIRGSRTATDGSLETYCGGLLDPSIGFLTNVMDVSALAGGAITKSYLNSFIYQVAEQSNHNELMVVCGGGFMQIIEELAAAHSFQFAEVPKQDSFGMSLTSWKTGAATLYFKVHKRMSLNAYLRNAAFFIAPEQLERFHLMDTDWHDVKATGVTADTGYYLTDSGMEIHHEYHGGKIVNCTAWA